MYSNPKFFLTLPWRIYNLKKSTHLFIGGGGLINDTFSDITIMRAVFDAAWAIKFGIPYHIIGIEIGCVYAPQSRERTQFLFRQTRSLLARDPKSLAEAIKVFDAPPDTSLEIPDLSHATLRDWFNRSVRRQGNPGSRHCILNPLFSPIQHKEQFVRLVSLLSAKFAKVTLVAAQPGEEADWIKLLGVPPKNLAVFASGDWEPPLELLADADVVVAERFHYIAAGAHSGAQVVPITYSNKASHLALSLGLSGQTVNGSDYSADAVMAAIARATPASDSILDDHARRLQSALDRLLTGMAQPRPSYTRAARQIADDQIRQILKAGVRQKLRALRQKLT